MKKIFSTLALGLICIILPTAVFAAEFRSSQNGSVELGKNESAKNLYIAGNSVNVSGTAKGDLVAAGNTINVSGPVGDGLFAAGSSINVSGAVGKNARIAGSNINIVSNIGGDLLVGGATLTISPESSIGGDLVAGVNTMTLNGPVNGKLMLAGNDITINSKIDGNVEVEANNLVLGDNANIGGSLTYKSPKAAQISSSAVVAGTTDFKKTKTETKTYNKGMLAGVLGIFGFMGLLMGLVLLFVLVYILPRSSLNLVKKTLVSFWTNFGIGFLTFTVIPMALIIISVTVIGLKLAGVVFLLYIGLLSLAFTFAPLAIGAQILKWIEKKDYRVDWLTILVGTFSVIILGLIPVIGSVIIWVVSVAVLGQLIRRFSAFLKSQR